MSVFLAWIITAIIIGLAIMQAVYVVWYYRFLTPQPTAANLQIPQNSSESENCFQPPVAIVLCLRGADPSLTDCFAGLMAQEYENYQLHLVIDTKDDPVREIIDEFFANRSPPVIHVVSEIKSTCTLKCSAILEALQQIPDSTEIVAFVDADTVPDENWLQDLIAPFSDPSVGATTGNRWFAPNRSNLGSAVRKIWNAAAVVQTDIYNIAWGGTLAVRRSTIDECNLVERWGHAFCEDTMVSHALSQHDQRLVRIPNLIMENTESARLPDAFRWITRQILTVRLHHPRWQWVLAHAFATGVAGLMAPVMMLFFLLADQLPAFRLLLWVNIIYQGFNLTLLWILETKTKQAIESRDGFNQQSDTHLNFSVYFIAVMVTQLVQPLACLCAAVTKQVSWRGIDYRIKPNRSIEMIEYRPYRKVLEARKSTDPRAHSIG